jgi:serine/threonine-protein kinase RsbW
MRGSGAAGTDAGPMRGAALPARPSRRVVELGPIPTEEPALTRWLEAAEADVVRCGSERGLDGDSAHFLGVALREAVVNALRHGGGPAGVSVRMKVLPGSALVLTVRDHGRGFDPGRVPDCTAPENLDRGCGRGLFFIRRFTDRVSFLFPRRGGAVIRLEKRLPRS